ncbi:MAG: hypothetical protein WC810_22665 [Janthinobacterium sp.]|jgi:hypothetical protein
MYLDNLSWAIEKGVSQEVIVKIIKAGELYSLYTLIGVILGIAILFVSICFIIYIFNRR